MVRVGFLHKLTVQSVCVSSVLFLQTRSRMTSRDLSPETRTPSLRISCLRSSVSSQMKNGPRFFYATLCRAPRRSTQKKTKKQKSAPGVSVCFGRRAEEPDGAVCAYIVRRKAPDVASSGRPAPGRHKAACCALRRAGLASSTRNCHNSHDEANPSPPTPPSHSLTLWLA